MNVVNKIWDQYDDDGNGVLDYQETQKFISDYMSSIGANVDEIDENVFREMFKQCDKDGS